MTEKLDSAAIEKYSEACAERMLEKAYAAKVELSGRDLLSLTPVQQVNLFVLRELLEIWSAEAMRMRSPFFNYTAPEVQDSFRNLMNVLSNNIAVHRETLVPLTWKAVARSLFLILNPYDFYSSLIAGNGVIAHSLRTELRYIKINPAPLARLAEEAEKRSDPLTGKEALATLDGILEEVSFSPEDVEPHLKQFTSMCPLELRKLYRVVREKKAHEPVKAPLTESGRSSHELAKSDDRPTLADTFQRQRIQTIRDNLSINQKFMFTKTLFDGDFEAFNNAIVALDACRSLSEANRFISKNFVAWDRESEEYVEFSDILIKRFND